LSGNTSSKGDGYLFPGRWFDDEKAKGGNASMASHSVSHSLLTKPASTRPYVHGVKLVPAHRTVLPVLRPQLPPASEILPYLEAIDARRWYSNGGPLVASLEEQLSRHLGSTDCVVTTTNATLGITASLLSRRVPAGSLCLMPSWTFVATPHAARAAGLTPWFHDVDRRSWALDPAQVLDTLRTISGRVGAIIVVSPFAAPIDMQAWQEFEDTTGICVIVDGAAAFDTVRVARIPTVVSLHATKILGAGEGGFIATGDPEMRSRLQACCNFGFLETRSAAIAAINAKMSEYHAAVALASLVRWPLIRAQHARIAEWYRSAIGSVEGLVLQPGYGEDWVTGTTSVVLPPGSASQVADLLRRSGIDTRKWWGEGCHNQPAFADCPRGPLPVTEDLGGRVLGLPHFPDMRSADVDRVVEALEAAVASWSRAVMA
jgi:dTDP-4-amino-4,6-dideoxygalactose transaminase